jgi:hydroxymethylglutaryl-CoA reductase
MLEIVADIKPRKPQKLLFFSQAQKSKLLLVSIIVSAIVVGTVGCIASSNKNKTAKTCEILNDNEKQALAAKFDRLSEVVAKEGTVRVMVDLCMDFTPEGELTDQQVAKQRAMIAKKRQELIDSLRGTEFQVNRKYNTIPYIALSLSGSALNVLKNSGNVASISEDEADPVQPS